MDDLLMEADAVLSDCRKYRYRLRRMWSSDPAAVFVMLNPSTADEREDDATIRRCMGFAREWGCGGIVVVNLFAIRSVNPAAIKMAKDPVGPFNNSYIILAAQDSRERGGKLVCAWGNHGAYLGRGTEVAEGLRKMGADPLCLAVTASGQPAHPLYQRRGIVPQPYVN